MLLEPKGYVLTMKNKDKEQTNQEPENIQEEHETEVVEPEVTEAETDASVDEWRQALEIAVKQRDEYLDSLRRTQADFQNFKRRNQTTRADAYEEGIRDTITALLPSIDNLERAIAAAGDEKSPIVDGVKMTLNQLMDNFKRFGLEEIPAKGEKFDPELHHAVMREVGDEPDVVLEVLQKGYKVKDKVIRYSMVKVSVEE